MRPSSFVFVAIVALWAAHLLPQWIRRRDALGASRRDDRHSAALRVLGRRRRRRVPGRSTAPLLPGVPVVTAPAPGPASPLARPAPRPVPGAAARRRRTVLAVLSAVTVLSVAGALAGVVPAAFAVVVVLLLGLDVAALRAVALGERRRAAELAHARRAAAREAARVAARAARPVAAPLVVAVEPAPVPRDADLPAAPAEQEQAAVVDDTWVPVPVPPPTYTLKPMAPRPEPARLEPALDPAAAVAAGPSAQAAAVAEDLEPASGVDLDSVLERRRAVNG